MTSGAGRPGQPAMGQRSIFGTGRGPVFAQMPAYTPVTRGSEPQPQHLPEPPKPDFGAYGRDGGVDPRSLGHSNPSRTYTTPDFPNPFPPQNYQRQQPSYPPQGYQTEPSVQHNRPAPSQPAPMPQDARPGHGYQPRSQPAPLPPSARPGHGYQPKSPPARSFKDGGFSRRESPAETAPNGGLAGQNSADAHYPDASFGDASFPDAGFPTPRIRMQASPRSSRPTQAPRASLALPPMAMRSTIMGRYISTTLVPMEQSPATIRTRLCLAMITSRPCRPTRRCKPSTPFTISPHRSRSGASDIRTKPSRKDSTTASSRMPTSSMKASLCQRARSPTKPTRKFSLKSRSIFMVGSALLGAVALGGALAFAYKQSGGAMGEGAQPPVVQADSRPVKEAPQQASGKDFPHKNKLIYERLQNGDQPEAERIVPRQEDVAMPAMPGSASMAAPQPAPGAPPQVATVDDPNAADGGARRVKTLVVRPDGSVMPPSAQPAPQQAAPADAAPAPAPEQQMAAAEPAMPAMPTPQAAPPPVPVAAAAPAPAPAPAPVAAAAPAPAPAPAPVAADPQPVAAIPAKQKVAAADAAPAPAKPSQYVVQVGSKQNQTEALATFADMQQKYPTLLAS